MRNEPDPAALVERVLGPDALAGDPDAWRVRDGRPAAVALPADEAEAAALLRAASGAGVRVLPAGRGTWLGGGGSPGPVELVVSTLRMVGIVQYEPADLTLTAGAGLALDALVRSTGEHGQWLPVDPPGRPDGSLGATVATASGGFLRTRYGSIRDLTLGATLVTGDGRVLRLGGRVVKNVAGFDLVRLAVGSWGTLGLVTEVTVLLQPRPPETVRLGAWADRMEALVPAAAEVARAPFLPGRVEIREVPTEDGERRAVLAVTLHGPDAAVRSEARTLREAAPELEEMQTGLEVPEPAREPDLVVRMRLSAGEPGALVEVARALGRLEGGRDVLEGAPVVHRVDPLAGVARVMVSNVRTDSGWSERWAVRLEDLRRTLLARRGGLTVEAAPASILERTCAWQPAQGVEAELSQRLRDSFDPERILAPERFAPRGPGSSGSALAGTPG